VDILKGRFKPGSTIIVDVKEGKVAFRAKREKKAKEKVTEELAVG
jgi:hypothetical protein